MRIGSGAAGVNTHMPVDFSAIEPDLEKLNDRLSPDSQSRAPNLFLAS